MGRVRVVSFVLPVLHGQLEADAKAQRRSLSQIIEFALEEHYKPGRGGDPSGIPVVEVAVPARPSERPVSATGRSEKCPHGMPAGAYCRRCADAAGTA